MDRMEQVLARAKLHKEKLDKEKEEKERKHAERLALLEAREAKLKAEQEEHARRTKIMTPSELKAVLKKVLV